jgi:hypothetical protein
MAEQTEPTEAAEAKPEDPASVETDDDERRAAAAAANRKRATEEWEENKKRWRNMGVPPALPAAGSVKPKK